MLARPLGTVTLALVALVGRVELAHAQATPAATPGAPPVVDAGSAPAAAPEKPVRWHGTTLLAQQRVSTETVGLGADVQSRNPYYEISLYLRPRYYMWEEKPSSLSLRAQFVGSYEATNSDSTTRLNELLLEDSTVSLVGDHTFGHEGDYPLLVALTLPRLVIPTSKASGRSGKIMDLGARALVDQTIPLRKHSRFMSSGRLAARLGYGYSFVHGTTPTSVDLNRLRMDVDGHLAQNGQLSGAAFAEHSGVLRGIVGADIVRDILSFALELGVDPVRKRKLPPASVTLPTGSAELRSVESPQRDVPVSYFDVSLTAVMLDKTLDLSLGYEHVTGQIGSDGQRRDIAYGPDAKLYLAAELHLDHVYGKLKKKRERRAVATAD